MTQAKIQVDRDDYEFIKRVHRKLNYRSFSEYVRDAIKTKIKVDQKGLREMKRKEAMEMIGKSPFENIFESLEGEDLADR